MSDLSRLRGPIHMTPDTAPIVMPDVDNMGYVYILPQGPRLNNELGDTVYIQGASVPYHDHRIGWETFLVDGGSVEITVNRKRCLIGKGDLLQVRPHCHHGFTFLEEGTIWREMFQQMEMYDGITHRDILKEKMPDIMEDPEFKARRLSKLGTSYRDMPLPREVAMTDIPEVIPHDHHLRLFEMPGGVKLGLKVPRWDFDGGKEIWELMAPKGLRLEYAVPFGDSPVFVVMKGEITVEIFGEETYVARERDIIHIPPFTTHTITVTAENTRVFAYNEQSELLYIMEELYAAKVNTPEKLDDWNWIEPLLRRHNNWLTGVALES